MDSIEALGTDEGLKVRPLFARASEALTGTAQLPAPLTVAFLRGILLREKEARLQCVLFSPA